MTNKTPLLSEFLLQTDTQIRFFDLGRRISKISLADFQKFERAEVPHPYPYEQAAWIGLIYWNKKDKAQHNIWFLRLPLDETGFIQLSARDEFMRLLMSRFSETMQQVDSNEALAHVLKDNPYVFKPTEDKMAVFHSKALLVLQQQATQFYADTMKYFQGNEYQHWQNLGFQGIADVAVRQDQKDVHQALLKALPKIPEPVFNAFGQCLENEACDIAIAKIIARRMSDTDSEQLIANGIRALTSCQSLQFKQDTIHKTLEKLKPNQSLVLVAIAAKSWEVLTVENILKLFLEKLACNDTGPELFNSLMVDLMFIPGLRAKILTEFRDPNRSDSLSNAVGSFFQAVS